MLARIVYSGLLLFAALFFLSFALNQTWLFLKLKRQYTEQLQHDLYTLHTICLKDEIRTGLGEKNAAMCRSLEDNVLQSPTINAIRQTLNETYLCGSVPCSVYIKDALALIYIESFSTFLVIMIVASVTIRLGLNWVLRFSSSSAQQQQPSYYLPQHYPPAQPSIYRLHTGLPFDSLSKDSTYYLASRPHYE